MHVYRLTCLILLGLTAASGVMYRWDNPARVYTLPLTLTEISGISWMGSNRLACIQDEHSMVYVYDTAKQRITGSLGKAIPGDFEGIALRGSEIFILRSDGLILHMDTSGSGTWTERDSGTAFKEAEALCYDPVTDRLILVPKSVGSIKEERHLVSMHSLDPLSLKADPRPFLTIDTREITRLLSQDKSQKKLKKALNIKKDSRWYFRASAVAVHPESGHFYLLSAIQRVWVEVDREGRPLNAGWLDKKIFPQAEGMTFDGTGRLFVATESQKEPARILLIPGILSE